MVNWLRDLGTNAAIAILAGVSALGVWSVAFRILQIPLVFLSSLWRVSFPAMSKLVAARENVSETIERALGVTAVVSGLILAPLVAATPAWVPALLGSQWTDAVAVIPPASLHLMVIGPISVAVMGYLFAVGDASAVLRSTLVGFPLMFAVMIPLLMVIGVPAVGYGWLAWGIGEGTVLVLSARKHIQFRIRPSLMRPTIFAVAGASLGWLVASKVGTTVVGGLAGALFAAGTPITIKSGIMTANIRGNPTRVERSTAEASPTAKRYPITATEIGTYHHQVKASRRNRCNCVRPLAPEQCRYPSGCGGYEWSEDEAGNDGGDSQCSFDRLTDVFARCNEFRHRRKGDPPQRAEKDERNLKNAKRDAPYAERGNTGQNGNSRRRVPGHEAN